MRSTASLANAVIKQWDCAWLKVAHNQGLIVDLFVRYVDDCRLVLTSLNEGWRWSSKLCKFAYSEDVRENDLKCGETDQYRTMREVTKMMCSLTKFL